MKIILILAFIALVKMAHACSASNSNECLHRGFHCLSTYFTKTKYYVASQANPMQCKELQTMASCLQKASEGCDRGETQRFTLTLPYHCSKDGEAGVTCGCNQAAATDCLKMYSPKMGQFEPTYRYDIRGSERADVNKQLCKILAKLQDCLHRVSKPCGQRRTRVVLELPYKCDTAGIAHVCSSREGTACLKTSHDAVTDFSKRLPAPITKFPRKTIEHQCKNLRDLTSCLNYASRDCDKNKATTFKLVLPYRCSAGFEIGRVCNSKDATECLIKRYDAVEKLMETLPDKTKLPPQRIVDQHQCNNLRDLESCLAAASENCDEQSRTSLNVVLPHQC